MRRFIPPSLILAILLVGCSGSNNVPVTGVNADKAMAMNQERNAFETSEDPPIKAETHFAAGQLAETNGDLPNAVKQYKEALKIDPKHKKALYRQAVCLSELKKFTEAAGVWKRFVEVTDGDPRGYSNLGFCYELAGRVDQAETAYRGGIDKDPKNVPCRTNYGLMLARLGRTAEATLQLQAVLTPAEVHYNLASVLEHQGRNEAAKAEYRKALELNPKFEDAQTRLSALQ
ncbi:MAG TPA: tetratricopeptide repeat protein [Tepidisphaeraceae bacterium]|jgi:tetratricopeptide (TPR) repeat protein